MVRMLLVSISLLGIIGCGQSRSHRPEDSLTLPRKLQLSSTAWTPGSPIPGKYSYDGTNVSPPLAWSGIPAGAKELALIVDDPDAPTRDPFVHWVLYKIPVTEKSLPEGLAKKALVNGMSQGRNSFARLGYDGPAPPAGKVHQYHFRLYALKEPLSLPPEATGDDLRAAMAGRILDIGELIGTYRR